MLAVTQLGVRLFPGHQTWRNTFRPFQTSLLISKGYLQEMLHVNYHISVDESQGCMVGQVGRVEQCLSHTGVCEATDSHYTHWFRLKNISKPHTPLLITGHGNQTYTKRMKILYAYIYLCFP